MCFILVLCYYSTPHHKCYMIVVLKRFGRCNKLQRQHQQITSTYTATLSKSVFFTLYVHFMCSLYVSVKAHERKSVYLFYKFFNNFRKSFFCTSFRKITFPLLKMYFEFILIELKWDFLVSFCNMCFWIKFFTEKDFSLKWFSSFISTAFVFVLPFIICAVCECVVCLLTIISNRKQIYDQSIMNEIIKISTLSDKSPLFRCIEFRKYLSKFHV